MAYFPVWQDLTDYCSLQPDRLLAAGQSFVEKQCAIFESKLHDQLRNRYDVPFLQPNDTAKGWIAVQVAFEVLRRTGVDPTDVMYGEYRDAAKLARDEITAAANSDTGLFELPLLVTKTPAVRGFRGLSDADPGAWKRRQGERARQERAAWPRLPAHHDTSRRVTTVATIELETVIEQYMADESLSALRVVRLAEPGHVVIAHPADVESRAPIGVTYSAALAGSEVQVCPAGPITDASWSWVVGQPVLLGANGMLVQPHPTGQPVMVVMGMAVSADTIVVRIEPAIFI